MRFENVPIVKFSNRIPEPFTTERYGKQRAGPAEPTPCLCTCVRLAYYSWYARCFFALFTVCTVLYNTPSLIYDIIIEHGAPDTVRLVIISKILSPRYYRTFAGLTTIRAQRRFFYFLSYGCFENSEPGKPVVFFRSINAVSGWRRRDHVQFIERTGVRLGLGRAKVLLDPGQQFKNNGPLDCRNFRETLPGRILRPLFSEMTGAYIGFLWSNIVVVSRSFCSRFTTDVFLSLTATRSCS